MRILWIDPIVEDKPYVSALRAALGAARRPETDVEISSLPAGPAPRHLRYHAYEALVVGEIVKTVYRLAADYDAFVIGCFYDLALREAREVSGRAIVTAPCEASIAIASQLGNSFSVLVGASKAIPKMRENIRAYGFEHRLRSMRPLDMEVLEFQSQAERALEAMLREGKKAVEEDQAEVIVLGCSAEVGFHRTLQDALGVPVIDSALAPFKYAEFLAETANRFGWHPSRRWGSEPPPKREIDGWRLFSGKECDDG
ncbi:MAG: aspartate/glutamate racemase family protein [Chloroflexota bacterium]|nr:aspartate/glutamate racemase family protein [Chloroflexota bacterium]MDE2948973.1 aspartate/glutamate racemase family protein [Chloroflexota bacterium]